MMRILVAGGAGFLGSNLVNYLLDEGHYIIILDYSIISFKSTLQHLANHPRVTILEHDITEPIDENIQVHRIYHLACLASPKQYQQEPIHTLKTCYVGTENLLKLALRCKARLLFSSTSEIYGNPLVCPQPELYFGNTNSYGPRACYDEGKRVAESLCYAYQEEKGLDVRIARIFNAYGPGMPASDGRVVSNFISSAIQGQPIVITGDGSAVRCFQFITDCISGLIKLMDSDYSKPINIGSDIPYRIDELAVIILNIVKSNGYKVQSNSIRYTESPVDDPVLRQPDISLAKRVLDWKPVVSLEEGIQMTIDWFQLLQEEKDN